VPFVRYAKAAFLYHWNILALLAGLGFGAFSGAPDVVIPLVLAAEVAYLGLLGTHPRFQQYVDAQEAKSARERAAGDAGKTVDRILQVLPKKSVERFENLRSRCAELQQIAQGLRDPHSTAPRPLEDAQSAGLDRLLWIFLRLLFTQYMLERFFQRTTVTTIQSDIQRLQAEITRLGDVSQDEQKQKVKKALEDSLATSRERLANHKKARDNSELVRLELDRLENKIQSLSELAVNRQEPEFITTQVDQVATSMRQTEKTMTELEFITGLATEDESVPPMLRRETVTARD
jgi:chemotaxis protein histidine kinase CheA